MSPHIDEGTGLPNKQLEYIGEPHNSITINSEEENRIYSDNLFSFLSTPIEAPELVYFEVEIKPSTLLYSQESNYFYRVDIAVGSKIDVSSYEYTGSGVLLTYVIDSGQEAITIGTDQGSFNINDINMNQRIGIILDQNAGYAVIIINGEIYASPTQHNSAVGIMPYLYIEDTDLNDVQSISDVKPVTIITDRSEWAYTDDLENIGVLPELVSIKEANQLYSYVDMLSLPVDGGGGYDGELPV